MNRPQFEIVETTTGALSIRDNASNEIMHNPVGPWAEANGLYIEQCDLKGKLLDESTHEIVLFDVGLGAGTNAIAAFICARALQSLTKKNLRIISFEKNLDLVSFALQNADRFDYYRGWECAISSLIKAKKWVSESFTWELREGDFLDTIDREKDCADIVFFDPYSPKVNQEMWTTACFTKLYKACRRDTDRGCLLYTYSQATPIRAALLASGFYVGHGSGTGLKLETTEASTRLSDLKCPLGERWMKRWASSQTPYPFDCIVSDQDSCRKSILEHQQFCGRLL